MTFRKVRWTDAEQEAAAARREEEDRRRTEDLRRRERVANELGFHYPGPPDDPPIPRVCPTCGAMVPLSMVKRHYVWHEEVRP